MVFCGADMCRSGRKMLVYLMDLGCVYESTSDGPGLNIIVLATTDGLIVFGRWYRLCRAGHEMYCI